MAASRSWDPPPATWGANGRTVGPARSDGIFSPRTMRRSAARAAAGDSLDEPVDGMDGLSVNSGDFHGFSLEAGSEEEEKPEEEPEEGLQPPSLEEPILGRGGGALEDFVESVRRCLSRKGATGSACDMIIEKAKSTKEILLREREELAAETRNREADAFAHVELVRMQHQQLLETHSVERKQFMQLQEDHLMTKKRHAALEVQHRELVSRFQTTAQQLKHTETALKERTEAYTALKYPAETQKESQEAELGLYLIDDLCEDLLEHLARETHTEQQVEHLRAEVERLGEALQGEERKAEDASERARGSEKKISELEEQLAKAKRDMGQSDLMLSPRSTDAQALRARFKEAHDALRSKDEEIDELHKLLFELRPKLEREVEGQVKGIIEQAEHDAGRIRQEAQRLRDAHANRVSWQAQEIEQCRREIEVLAAAAQHRDELIEKLKQSDEDKEDLRRRLERLQAPTSEGSTAGRGKPASAWHGVARKLAAALVLAAAPLALIACAPPPAAPTGAAADVGGFQNWLRGKTMTPEPQAGVAASQGPMCEAVTKGVSGALDGMPDANAQHVHAGALVALGISAGLGLSAIAGAFR